MEDRLFAHQAVQDSVLISDDEIAAIGERQLQQLISQAGSLDRVLKVYKKKMKRVLDKNYIKLINSECFLKECKLR